MTDDLTKRLLEHADWCDANEWEIPITLGDDLRAAERMEQLERDLIDLVQMRVEDCELCRHGLMQQDCEYSDYDCMNCGAVDCICRECRNNNQFEWRGVRRRES